MKKLLALFLSVLLILTLDACGGEKDSDSDSGANASSDKRAVEAQETAAFRSFQTERILTVFTAGILFCSPVKSPTNRNLADCFFR